MSQVRDGKDAIQRCSGFPWVRRVLRDSGWDCGDLCFFLFAGFSGFSMIRLHSLCKKKKSFAEPDHKVFIYLKYSISFPHTYAHDFANDSPLSAQFQPLIYVDFRF